MKQLALIFFLLCLVSIAWAGGGEGAEHAEGIPSVVWTQLANFSAYVILLFLVLRKPITSFFKAREMNFRQALLRADSARKTAEEQKREIQDRLSKLESTSQDSISRARTEAESLRKQIIQEAELLSKSLREEAKRTAELEVQKAKLELREHLVSEAISAAQRTLNEKMLDQDQKRLQTEFVQKITVVAQ